MSKHRNAALIKHRPKPTCSKLMGIIMISTWPCSGQIHSDPEEKQKCFVVFDTRLEKNKLYCSGIDHVPGNIRQTPHPMPYHTLPDLVHQPLTLTSLLNSFEISYF